MPITTGNPLVIVLLYIEGRAGGLILDLDTATLARTVDRPIEGRIGVDTDEDKILKSTQSASILNMIILHTFPAFTLYLALTIALTLLLHFIDF